MYSLLATESLDDTPLGYTDMQQEIAADCEQNKQYYIKRNQSTTINNVHVMTSEFIHCVALHFYLHPYVHSYPCSGFILQNISDMLNKNSLGLLKKGEAKQSRIKRIIWHLRWLVRTRADISLRPSG